MFDRIRLLLVSLACVAVVPAVARAGTDQKTYPGAFCQQGGTSQALWYYHGRAVNPSTSAQVADCPIVSDAWWLYSGKATVHVVDRHDSADFSCTIHVYEETAASPRYQWSNRRSAGSGERVQILTFDFKNAPIEATAFSPMMIGCSIPGDYSGNRSDLVSYHVWEYETSMYTSNQ